MKKALYFYNQALFALFLITVITVPLYPKIPLVAPKGFPLVLRLDDLLIFFLIFFWLIFLLLSKTFLNLLKQKTMLLLLLFFAVALLSNLFAVIILHTVPAKLAVLRYAPHLETMLLLPVSLSLLNSKRKILLLLATLSFVTLITNLDALGQQFLRFPIFLPTNVESNQTAIIYSNGLTRVSGTFSGYWDFPIFLLMFLSFISSFVFFFKKRLVILYITLLVLWSYYSLVLAASRASFALTFVSSTVALLLVKQKKYILFLIPLAIITFIIPSQLNSRLSSSLSAANTTKITTPTPTKTVSLNTPTQIITQTTTTPTVATRPLPTKAEAKTTQLVQQSLNMRLNKEWPRAWRAFLKDPLLGVGYGSVGDSVDNTYLRSLAETGILGTLVLLSLLFYIAKLLWEKYKVSKGFIFYLTAGILAMMLGFLINGVSIDVFEASKIASLFWIMLGAGVASLNLTKNL